MKEQEPKAEPIKSEKTNIETKDDKPIIAEQKTETQQSEIKEEKPREDE